MIELKPLKESRMAHCISVAKLCYDFAIAHNYDPMKAYLCGIFHDIAREIPSKSAIALAKERGIPVGKEEEAEPLLLHGALAAAVMKENYHIDDEEMLHAVSAHTVGDETMGILDRIVFLADKTEPRRSYEGVDALREMGFVDLDGAFYIALSNEIAYCEARGYAVHPKTVALKNILDQERRK